MIYGLLFRAASADALGGGRRPKHLGAEIGFLAVLHTWGQNLMHHPHLHCVVPAGGICTGRPALDRRRAGFLLAGAGAQSGVSRQVHRLVKQAHDRGELVFHGRLAAWQTGDCSSGYWTKRCGHDWVVYAKPPFGGPQQVLKYLARYTHRVAISNRGSRRSMANGVVPLERLRR